MLGSAVDCDACARDAPARRATGAGNDVHRDRPGHRDGPRAGLKTVGAAENVRVNQDSANIELDRKARDDIGRITSRGPRPRLNDLYFFLTTIPWPALLLIVVGVFGLINCVFALGYMVDG